MSRSSIKRMQNLIHDEENRVRSYYSVAHLKQDAHLNALAQAHAEYMARSGRYEHSGNIAEIIHRGPYTAKSCVRGWWTSPPHFRILLSGTTAGHGHASHRNLHYWCSIIK